VLPCLFELEVLRLESCALGTRGVKEFSSGLVAAAAGAAHPAGHRSFRMIEINLQRNQAGSNAAEALAESLSHVPELQKFLYVGNRPAYEGLASLVRALVQCPALQVCADASPAPAKMFVLHVRLGYASAPLPPVDTCPVLGCASACLMDLFTPQLCFDSFDHPRNFRKGSEYSPMLWYLFACLQCGA
jgi:hypothetical protein